MRTRPETESVAGSYNSGNRHGRSWNSEKIGEFLVDRLTFVQGCVFLVP